MREQYFKHRTLFDFNKQTNDVGFALPWKSANEDNHFLFRLYRKSPDDYPILYQHHLGFFLNKYSDATEQEFFVYAKQLVSDAISAIQIIIATNEFLTISNPKKFACHSGVTPFTRESGKVIGKARVSHMADKKMKMLLHLCALSAILKDPELKEYYQPNQRGQTQNGCR
ncbi:MAG: IS110 family transposase [Mucilaginibacter sp.]